MAETQTQIGGGAELAEGIADRPPAPRLDPENVTAPTSAPGTSLTDINKAVTQEGRTPSFEARAGERNTTLEDANRAKMIASGELIAGGNEQLAQEKVNLFTYGVENPEFGATISSDGARSQFADDTKAIKDDFTTTKAQLDQGTGIEVPDFKLFEDFRGDFEQQRQEQKDIFARTVESIKQDFEIRETEQRDVNRVQAGTQSKNLARMGAFGRTGSALSFLKSVDDQNQRELNKLMVQKGQVLIEAADAASKRDLEALSLAVAHSQSLTTQFNKVQQARFEDQIMSEDQLMEQNKFGWELEDRAFGKMSQLFQLGVDPADETQAEDIKDLEETAGVPEGSYQKMWDLNKQEAADKAITDSLTQDIEFAKDLADILKDIPEGRSIKIGDTVYSGFKKGKTWTETTATDGSGNVVGLSFNQETGEWANPVSFGKIGVKTGSKTWEDGDGNLWDVDGATATPIVKDSVDKKFLNPRQLPGMDEYLKQLGGSVTAEFGDFFDGRSHTGLDIDIGKIGDQLMAYEGGTINKIVRTDQGGYGVYVEILGDDGRLYRYGHLQEGSIPNNFVAGETRVNTGDVFANMGASGNVVKSPGGDGGHLHFEAMLSKNGEQFNVGDPEGPIPQDKFTQEDFTVLRNKLDTFKGGDGLIDATVYNKWFEYFRDTYDGGADLFLEKYPPSTWLNPAQPESGFFIDQDKKKSGLSFDSI